jgi:hypothetical protein
MRRLHTLALVVALIGLAFGAAGAARAQRCPYMQQMYSEMQQQQRMAAQIQMMQAQQQALHQMSRMLPAQAPRVVSGSVTRPVPAIFRPVTTVTRMTNTIRRPALHEFYSLHSVTHPGTGHVVRPAVSLQVHRFVTVHPQTVEIPHAHTIVHIIPERQVTAHRTTVVPGTPPVQQHQVTHENRTTSAARVQVKIESETKMTTWSYAVCGRCHQQDPGKTPQLVNKPQAPLPKQNVVPVLPAPNLVPVLPAANLAAGKPRPQPQVTGQQARPNFPSAARRPEMPSRLTPSTLPGALTLTPPGRSWQPNLPSWALIPAPLPTAPALSMRTTPGDTPSLLTVPGTIAAQVPPPSLGLITTETPATESAGVAPPPDYPPLPRPSWDLPGGQTETPPSLSRVADADPAVSVEAPPLPAPSWAAGSK